MRATLAVTEAPKKTPPLLGSSCSRSQRFYSFPKKEKKKTCSHPRVVVVVLTSGERCIGVVCKMGDEAGDQNGALMSDPVDVIIDKLLRYVQRRRAALRCLHFVELGASWTGFSRILSKYSYSSAFLYLT